jgi:hypothetical protein
MPGNNDISIDFIVRGEFVKVELVQTGKSQYDVKANGVPVAELALKRKLWSCKSRATGRSFGGNSRDLAVSAFIYGSREKHG